MKTVIFMQDGADDVYNDNATIDRMLRGEHVVWRIWYDGDRRRKPTRAYDGDRFYVWQREVGIIASGIVGKTECKQGDAKLTPCGMTEIELIPDRVGRFVLSVEKLDKVSDSVRPSLNQRELVLERKCDSFLLEELWLEAIVETGASRNLIQENFWQLEHLNSMTVGALRHSVLKGCLVCPCCGSTLSCDDTLFYRPLLVKSDCNRMTAFEDLLTRYVMLCKECAGIEKDMKYQLSDEG